ncbi:MAG: AAA family ATPase [Myxococcota bacterium]
MSSTPFFDELLRLSPQAVLFECQRRLEAMHPGRAVLHTTSELFDLVRFLHERQATAEPRRDLGGLQQFWPDDAGTGVTTSLVHRWDSVTWEGARFEVVHLTLREDNCTDDAQFIVADDFAAAERFLLAVCRWCSTVRGEVLVYENSHFRRSEPLHATIQQTSFDDLILPPALLDGVRDDVRRFVHAKDTYARYRVPWKRGLLLLGPPGNGKTHTLRAIVRESGWPCLYVKSFQGRHEAEQGIAAVFARARRAAPCVVVLEDLDCLIDDGNRSVLLNELDGFAENDGLLVVATTNHPEKLDRSLLDRPSRFDRKFHFGLPAPEERRRYLARWRHGLAPELRASDGALEALVEGTHAFTFAYLKELTLAAMLAFMEAPLAGRTPGSMDELLLAVLATLKGEMSSARRLLPPLPETERRISLSA